MDPLEITETDSRKGSEIPKTNEKRDERKARTAANGAEKTETRKQKETEAKADRPWRKKRTKQTGSGYKVADLKSDSGVTWEKKEKAQRCNNKNQHES